MNTVRRHLCTSVILVVSFQVFNTVHPQEHNAHLDYSPMDADSDIDNQQGHLIDAQKYPLFDNRTHRSRPDKKQMMRKLPKNKDKYKADTSDDDNSDCMKCGLTMTERGGRIVNGKVVNPLYKYPWIVPLIQTKQIMCGGAIISRMFILTAAHCIFNKEKLKYPECRGGRAPKKCYYKANEFTIKLLGRQKLRRTMRVKRIIPHQEFDYGRYLNDIALLELEEPLKCTGKTSPICLPTKKEMYKHGQKLYVAGWGKNTPDRLRGPQLLKEGVMKEIEGKECLRPELPKETIRQYQCSAGTIQTTCQGDSGASNFIKYKGKFYALGITSHGQAPYCHPEWPTTFAKVLYFLQWIKHHVKDLPEP